MLVDEICVPDRPDNQVSTENHTIYIHRALKGSAARFGGLSVSSSVLYSIIRGGARKCVGVLF